MQLAREATLLTGMSNGDQAAAAAARPDPFARDLKVVVWTQLGWLLVTASLLDGGDLARWSAAACLGYWLGVLAIRARRPMYGRRTDRLFVRFGWLGLIVLATVGEPAIHRHIRW